MARRGQQREGDDRARRDSRQQYHQQREKQLALGITLGIIALFLLVVLIIALSSSGSSTPPAAAVQPLTINVPQPPPPPPPGRPTWLSTQGTAYALRTAAASETAREKKPHVSRKEKKERAIAAAKLRAQTYAKEERWGKAIQTIEAADEEYDLKFEGWTRDMLEDYNEKARVAARAAKQESDKLFEAGKYDAAIKLLKDAAEKIGTEKMKAEAQKKIDEIQQRKTAEANANFARCMAALEQDIVAWNFQGALAQATKLHFDEPEHQQQLDARIERIRFLIGLRTKMCDTINGAMPKLTRKEIRVPGGVDGDLIEANQDRIVAESPKGTDQIPWNKFGPEATTNLALRAGKKDDPNYRIVVARLLMEVGYLDKAKLQLATAKKLGTESAADEAELTRRIEEADKAKEKAEEPKAEPKEETKAEPKAEPKGEPKESPKAAEKADGK